MRRFNLFACMLFCALTLKAENSDSTLVTNNYKSWIFESDINYVSSHLYRGQKQSSNAMQAQIQGRYLSFLDSSLYGGIFNNFPFHTPNNLGVLAPYLGVTNQIQGLARTDFGITHYCYHQDTKSFFDKRNTTEVFAGAKLDCTLNPAVYIFYDFILEQKVVEGSINFPTVFLFKRSYDAISFENTFVAGYLHAKKWQKKKNHYSYLGLRSDLVYTFRTYTRLKLGMRFSMNNAHKNSLTNRGKKAYNVGFLSSVSLDF